MNANTASGAGEPARSSASIYAPCAQILFESGSSAAARGDSWPMLGVAHLRHGGGRGLMSPTDEHVVICTLGGTSAVTRCFEGRSETRLPKSGTFSVIPSGSTTQWHAQGPDETLHIYLNPARVDAIIDALPASSRRGASIEPAFAATDPWLAAFHRLILAEMHAEGHGAMSFGLFLSELEQMLVRHLIRRSGARPASNGRVSPLRPFLLARLKEYVRSNLGAGISLRSMASTVHMSPDHLVRAFTAAEGVTPYRWVAQQRLEAGARLLAQGELTIAQVAHQFGYRSASHFASEFRRRYSVTPTQFRQASGRDELIDMK